MTSIVNGYPCSNCSETSLAKRGIDPRNPTNDPVKAEELDVRAGKPPEPRSAVEFGGALEGLNASTQAGQTSRNPAKGLIVDLAA
jgi:hypothetical protein